MVRAVANRPVEAFTTDAAAPDWQSEGDNEIWYAPPDDQPLVDADGNPVEPAGPPDDDQPAAPDEATLPKEEQPERLDQEWLDRAIDRRPPRRREEERRRREEEERRGDTFAA
jgi:penicillin-binding protein 1A